MGLFFFGNISNNLHCLCVSRIKFIERGKSLNELSVIGKMLLAVIITYILSFPFSGFFKAAQWPVLRTRQSRASLLHSLYRIVFFNALVGGLVMAVGISLVDILDGSIVIVRESVVISLFLIALARVLGMTHFEALMDEIYILVLSVFGAFLYIWLSNAERLTLVLSNINYDLIFFYGIGILLVSLFIEGFWMIRGLRPSELNYHLFRKYYESQETHHMADYRDTVEKLFVDTINDCAKNGFIREFYWKTWSGEKRIAEALRNSIATQLYIRENNLNPNSHSHPYFNSLSEENKKIYIRKAKEYVIELHKNNRAFVIIPRNNNTKSISNTVEDILGIRPLAIPEVGIRR